MSFSHVKNQLIASKDKHKEDLIKADNLILKMLENLRIEQIKSFTNEEFALALQVAVNSGNKVFVRKLLTDRARLDIPCPRSGKTALYTAIENRHTNFAMSLVAAGADASQGKNKDGDVESPLNLAIRYNHVPMVRVLTEKGAPVTDVEFTSALQRKQPEVINHVLSNLKDEEMSALLAIAVKQGNNEKVKLLIQKYVDDSKLPQLYAAIEAIKTENSGFFKKLAISSKLNNAVRLAKIAIVSKINATESSNEKDNLCNNALYMKETAINKIMHLQRGFFKCKETRGELKNVRQIQKMQHPVSFNLLNQAAVNIAPMSQAVYETKATRKHQ